MNIVFDVGNVLIRWWPERAVAQHYPDPADALAYLERVGFAEWNLANDAGRGFAEAVRAMEAAHPGESAPLAGYLDHFAETIREPINGSWALLDRLKARGHRLFAITNFAAETWEVALTIHPRLATDFEDVVVSGREKLLKPAPEIFRLLCDRNGIAAADCLFIDDSPKNVTGAQAVGMAAHHFITPEALEADLSGRGLL